MAKSQGLLRSPTCGTYPQGLTWATSWPVRSLQSLRKAGGLCPCQRLAQLNIWYVSAFTRGNDLPRNAQTLFFCQCASGACPGADALRSHGSHENTGIVAACKVDVNMLSYDYGQTYDQTHNGSLGTTRQGSYRDHQAVVWVPFRCGGDPPGNQDGSGGLGDPHPIHPKQGTALLSPWLKPGVLRAGLIKHRC